MVELTEANGKPVFVNGDFVPNWEKFKAIRDNIWSNKELGLIKANWKKMDDTELSVLIGRPKSATTLRRCKLKLYRTRKVNKNSMKHWTELEIKTLKIEWKKIGVKSAYTFFVSRVEEAASAPNIRQFIKNARNNVEVPFVRVETEYIDFLEGNRVYALNVLRKETDYPVNLALENVDKLREEKKLADKDQTTMEEL